MPPSFVPYIKGSFMLLRGRFLWCCESLAGKRRTGSTRSVSHDVKRAATAGTGCDLDLDFNTFLQFLDMADYPD